MFSMPALSFARNDICAAASSENIFVCAEYCDAIR